MATSPNSSPSQVWRAAFMGTFGTQQKTSRLHHHPGLALAFGRALLDRNTREVLINGRTLSLTTGRKPISSSSFQESRIESSRHERFLMKSGVLLKIASDRIVHSIIERLQVKLKTEALVFGLIENHGGRGYSLAAEISSTPSGGNTKCEVVPIPKRMDETSLAFFRTSILVFYSHRRSPRIRRDESSMYSILFGRQRHHISRVAAEPATS